MSVPTILYLSMLLSIAVVLSRGPVIAESCDMIELNHVHNADGSLMFSQVVFWKWHRDENNYHARDYVICGNKNKPQCNYRNGLYEMRWNDCGNERFVTAKYFQESWTQYDTERKDLKYLPLRQRFELIHRTPSNLKCRGL